MSEKPRCPADPRSNNKPFYRSDKCDQCGAVLQLTSLVEDPDCPENEIWHDDWICVECNLAYFDWPKEEIDAFNEELDRRIQELDDHPERAIPWDEVKGKYKVVLSPGVIGDLEEIIKK